VIITAKPSDPQREVFDRYSIWPPAVHADTKPVGERVCYFCEGKTTPGKKPAKLQNCIRAVKSAPGFNIPAGAGVIQEFRHMGVEGVDRNRDSARIDYPWGYGLGYNYGDGNQYGLWRIEVSPQMPSKLDNFLHVLHPSLKGAGMAKTELIASESGNLYGAHVGDRAVIFSRNAERQGKGTYTLRGNGTVWQLLCNLKPNESYRITQGGRSILTRAASKQGTIHFESQLAGEPARFEFQLNR
jgi:ribosomal protein L24E